MQTTPNEEPKKKKKASPLFIIILIIAIGVFVFAGYNLLKIGMRYKEAADSYEKVEQMLEPNPDYSDQAGSETAGTEKEGKKYHDDPVPFIWDYNKLLSINPDTKGWIYAKDIFSYPIVQTTDNDHYLHTTFDGTPNPSGALFVDCQMPEGLNGLYSIVYGHNMNDGSMFGVLHKYHQDPDFYKKHPTMHVFIGEKHYVYNVVAGYYAAVDGFTYFDPLNNADMTDFIDKAKEACGTKMYTGEITDDTNIIILSTCTETSSDDSRYVIVLSRDHEVE